MRDIIEQYEIRDRILRERLDTVLPAVMKETGTECWLIASREYNEDPMFRHIVPSLYPTARRLTILILSLRNDNLRRISVSMPDPNLNIYYEHEFDRDRETQFEALTRVLRSLDPGTISINVSSHHGHTDGLSHGLYEVFLKELPEDITGRFTSGEKAGIRLMETRTDTEMELYPEVMHEALEIISRIFSDEVIVPGVSTCRDLMNEMTRMVNARGITTWFPPDIDLQNEKGKQFENTVIQRGDLLHCDFGITYMNMRTDTQRLCYVLKEGEEDVPAELKTALERNNRFQDIVRENMKPGSTGNEVFLNSVRQGKEAGIRPVLYSHPLGLFGHSCGPTIGLWNDQNPIYPAGEYVLHDRTGYALELSTIEYLDMYRRDTYISTEESVVLAGGTVSFLCEGRDRYFIAGRKKD